MNCDVMRLTLLLDKQESHLKSVRFLAMFYQYTNSCICSFILLSTLDNYVFCCLSFNPFFVIQKCQIQKIVCFMNLVKYIL